VRIVPRQALAGCESCRGALAALRRKFAALDLLRDENQPSAGLIERVAQVAETPVSSTISLPRHMFWFSGVAAAVVIGCTLLLISNNDQTQRGETDRIGLSATQPPSAGITPEGGGATSATAKSGLANPQATGSPSLAMDMRGGGPAGSGWPYTAATPGANFAVPGIVAAPASALAIAEPPPFAPASAIELVVLPKRENVQLTIYNSADLTLVREKRNLTLKRGWNWLQFMWANTLIDPTSIELSPLEQKDRVLVQQLVFPPRLKELGRWLIHSDMDGQVPFELTYFTSGLAWRAFYMGTLAQDEKTMRLESYVRVDNRSGEEYADAKTRLIVGQIHLLDQIAELAKRQYPYGGPEGVSHNLGLTRQRRLQVQKQLSEREAETDREVLFDSFVTAEKAVEKEGLSEYFLYTIEGTETIPDQWGKRLLSFKADDIPVKNLYKYDEERFGDQAVRFLSFKNDTEHKLGTTPIPDGMVRIYSRTDAEKHLAYVGGTSIKYIPVNEEVELDLGPARLVKVEPKLMEERTDRYLFDNRGDIVGWDDVGTWKIEATNASTLPIDVEITRGFGEPAWELTTTGAGVTFEKYDITHARFKLSIEPRSKKVFTYTVTQHRGTQAESFNASQQEAGR
jgi:hypothetical protein